MITDLVMVIDTSYSTGESISGFGKKIDAIRDAILVAARRFLEQRGNRLGVIVFYGRAYPILPLSNDIDIALRVIRSIRVLGEASAPGDGLIEAVKLLRRARLIAEKKVVIVTDGGFNEGIPLDLAAIYAKNMNTKVNVVTLGTLTNDDERMIKRTIELTNGVWLHADTKQKLISYVTKASLE